MNLRLWITGMVFVVLGALHFVIPKLYLSMMPRWLPSPLMLVYVSGAFEILGGVGLLLPSVRTAAAIGLIVLLIAVFPANIEMLRLAQERGSSPAWLAALWLRLPLQPFLMWWVWRVGQSGHDLVRGS